MLSDITSIASYYSSLITAIATVALAIITAIYVRLVYKQLRFMREQFGIELEEKGERIY